MGYTLHSATVGLKMLAAWWNEFVFAIGDIDARVLVLEGRSSALLPVDSLDTTQRAVPAGTTPAGISGAALTVNFTTPPSGRVIVHVSAEYRVTTNASATGGQVYSMMTSAALSGANSRVANRERSLVCSVTGPSQTSQWFGATKSFLYTGLAAGSNTLTMQHWNSAATVVTGDVTNRNIIVQPLY